MLKYVEKQVAGNRFARPDDMDPVIYELLIRRGIDSEEAAVKFLNPSEADLNDPMLLSDILPAIEMIRSAVENDEHICVFGDYDADGVCASAIMTILMRKLGADFEVYLPSRHKEGYGLNIEAIEEIASRSKLLVTVDCGISCRNEIERAKELGLKCVVTDHHRPGDNLPDCPIINPLLNDYPYPWLCGAGVAFKLTDALLGRDEAMDVIDIAAIATVADIVSLTGENRAIVKLGLDAINRGARPGVRELIRSAGIEDKRITATDIAFRLAPRINAGGRLASAEMSYELIVAETEFDAVSGADSLEQVNSKRKELQDGIIEEALNQLQDIDFNRHRILLVRGKGWNHGVIGLAAAHLQKVYNYPVIVFAEKDGLLTGSCRSIPGIDIYQTLSSASEMMVKFGGHAQAAGCTIEEHNFPTLWERLDTYIRDNFDPSCYLPTAEYDMELPIDRLDIELMRKLEVLEPTGCDNPVPVFRARTQLIERKACGNGRHHLQVIAQENGKRVKGIAFGKGDLVESIGTGADILYKPTINIWMDRVNVEMMISDIRTTDIEARFSLIETHVEAFKCDFLTEIVYNKRYTIERNLPIITRDELKAQLESNIQGTYVICRDIEEARKVAEWIDHDAPEISAGGFPSDPRGFNAAVIYPSSFDDLPRSVRTLVFAGVPVPAGLPKGITVYELEGYSDWDIDVPSVDDMREVYKAVRGFSRKPVRIGSRSELDHRAAEETGFSTVKCRLSLLALFDMKLVEFQRQLIVPKAEKTDPESSEVWKLICGLK